MILLRPDVHAAFDAKRFIIVPKKGKWVIHVLEAQDKELIASFHNVHMQPLIDIAVEFIFARFLYAIFSKNVLPGSGRSKHKLLVIKAGEDTQTRVELTGIEYNAQLAPRSVTNSMTSSPRKRPRHHGSVGDRDMFESESDDDSDNSEFGGCPRRRLSIETISSFAPWTAPSPTFSPNNIPNDLNSERIDIMEKARPHDLPQSHQVSIVSHDGNQHST
ncbi:hypothetical protein E4U55_002576 [Claviceps digitariae]|nr:hypothetical protein E4U55_002576 [Claviceps digitariae]